MSRRYKFVLSTVSFIMDINKLFVNVSVTEIALRNRQPQAKPRQFQITVFESYFKATLF